MDNVYFPVCDRCRVTMKPYYFTEEEYKYYQGRMYKTGRKKRAVSHFVCPLCLKNEAVDDTFDGRWYMEN